MRIKLWSYSDLMSLRTIAWLRATKTAPDGHDVPATAMSAVRRALKELAEHEIDQAHTPVTSRSPPATEAALGRAGGRSGTPGLLTGRHLLRLGRAAGQRSAARWHRTRTDADPGAMPGPRPSPVISVPGGRSSRDEHAQTRRQQRQNRDAIARAIKGDT
ncbi:MAG TPA: hypothetical protein VGP30_06175 [Candidatus Limnocylindrales bacterium]|nr:hypothetical protein [Candidatus Limnocylindrales bacterium]